jgi:hypothetical protein
MTTGQFLWGLSSGIFGLGFVLFAFGSIAWHVANGEKEAAQSRPS